MELLCGPPSSRADVDVSRVGHHGPPLRTLPDPLRCLRLSGGIYHCHGALHPAQRGQHAHDHNTCAFNMCLSVPELMNVRVSGSGGGEMPCGGPKR